MERKTDFKECPKCGLRNKPTSVQCDFCGQSLTSGDDWQSHVKDLEFISKVDSHKQVDDQTSRRIESTIIRKEPPRHKVPEVEDVANLEDILKEFDQVAPAKSEATEEGAQDNAVRVAAPVEPLPEAAPQVTQAEVKAEESPLGVAAQTEPLVEEPVKVEEAPTGKPLHVKEEERTVETKPSSPTSEPEIMSGEVQARSTKEVTVDNVAKPVDTVSVVWDEVVVVDETTTETSVEDYMQPLADERTFLTPYSQSKMMVIGVLALGIFIYAVTMALIAIGLLDAMSGLSLGAVSSLMIVFGAIKIYPSLSRNDPGEVFICPKCHESVDRSGKCCPACGAVFLPED
jgi:hypothetical protein